MTDYTPPQGNKVSFDLKNSAYTPPQGNKIAFNLTHDDDLPPAGDIQYIFPDGLNATQFGDNHVRHQRRMIFPVSITTPIFSNPKIYNKTSYIQSNGFVNQTFGQASLKNRNINISATGFDNVHFSTPKIYNLKQIISVQGFNACEFGTASLYGGVKTLKPTSIHSIVFGQASVVNTKAIQRIKPSAIIPTSLSNPIVQPWSIYPMGFRQGTFGQPTVYRNPSPKGFETSVFGTAWVSHSPRHIIHQGFDSFILGQAKIFDPRIYISVSGVYPIVGGVFGDITIFNKNKYIQPNSWLSEAFSQWSIVYSNARDTYVIGFDSCEFGNSSISNVALAIYSKGFDSFECLNIDIGYRIRHFYLKGYDASEYGKPLITKPPQIKISGFDALEFGDLFISNYYRYIETSLGDISAFGECEISNYKRYISIKESHDSMVFGVAYIEYIDKKIIGSGFNKTTYGIPRVSFAKRFIDVLGIAPIDLTVHKVGGEQYIYALGFDTSAFGVRIIPEIQAIYVQGILGVVEMPSIEFKSRVIKPRGFLSNGQESARFGFLKTWNRTQYIIQFEDVNSGLAPLDLVGWTAIANRNCNVSTFGFNAMKVGYQSIENKARPILPKCFDASNFGRAMIADRIRYLKPSAIENPYISGWGVVYNSARVITPKGIASISDISTPKINNTRRYLNRIGNFDSAELGTPMVSFAEREITFEQRYGIHPPVIPLPTVCLYTRYIEDIHGLDHQKFGLAELNIRWNKITPRWAHKDLFGVAEVKNKTPMYATFGHNSEEFGTPSVRLEWESYAMQGDEMLRMSKPIIAFRDRPFPVQGISQWIVPRPKVTKTVSPPFWPQHIWLDAVEIDGIYHQGHGIKPMDLYGRPLVRDNVIRPDGFNTQKFGDLSIQSNGILIEYGMYSEDFGIPIIKTKSQYIDVVDGIKSQTIVGNPGLSPYTIYAVTEAPEQAKQNHPVVGNLHPVNSGGGSRPAGEVFGLAHISHKNRTIKGFSIVHIDHIGTPDIALGTQYANIKGFNSFRTGYHRVSSAIEQEIRQYLGHDSFESGIHKIGFVEPLHRTIKPLGFDAFVSTGNEVMNLNRELKLLGFDAAKLGTRLNDDSPFMWQGLRVGELVSGEYGGFESTRFGEPWVSHRVRELKPEGFESFISDYDHTQFDKRMRVSTLEQPIPQQYAYTASIDDSCLGIPDIKLKAHYIRPDGNADQFRKGGW